MFRLTSSTLLLPAVIISCCDSACHVCFSTFYSYDYYSHPKPPTHSYKNTHTTPRLRPPPHHRGLNRGCLFPRSHRAQRSYTEKLLLCKIRQVKFQRCRPSYFYFFIGFVDFPYWSGLVRGSTSDSALSTCAPQAYKYESIRTRTHMHTYMHIHAHTCTYMHIHAHTHTTHATHE